MYAEEADLLTGGNIICIKRTLFSKKHFFESYCSHTEGSSGDHWHSWGETASQGNCQDSENVPCTIAFLFVQ